MQGVSSRAKFYPPSFFFVCLWRSKERQKSNFCIQFRICEGTFSKYMFKDWYSNVARGKRD